jgi:uncharacterized protein with HEPN domain
MYECDTTALIERFEDVLEALERIPRRINGIASSGEFEESEEGRDRLDAICMILIAVGEALKQIDGKTAGNLLGNYPEVNWRGVIGVRNVIAHGYFDIDVEQIFQICKKDVPTLIKTVSTIVEDLRSGPAH